MLSQAVKGVSNLLLVHTNWTMRELWHAKPGLSRGAVTSSQNISPLARPSAAYLR